MEYEQQNGLREQPLGELLKRLSQQVSALARQEVELAKAELALKARAMGRVGGLFGAAALLGLCALGRLHGAADPGSRRGDSRLGRCARRDRRHGRPGGPLGAHREAASRGGRCRPCLRETIESTKEDIKWAKTQLQSGRR